MSSSITIGEGIRHGAAIVRAGWRQAGLVLALNAVAATLFTALQPSPDAGQPGSPLFILAGMAYLPLAIAAQGALYRLSLTGPGLAGQAIGPGGLQWSSVEWRLVRFALLLVFLAVLLILAMIFVLAIAALGMGVSGSTLQDMTPAQAEAFLATPQGLMLFVGSLVFYALLIWTAVRLSLAGPATASSEHVLFFETWPVTKGNFWRLLAGLFLCASPAILAGALLGSIAGGAGSGAIWAVSAASAMINAFITLPLQTGYLSYAYQRLAPDGVEPRSPRVADNNQRDDED